MPLKQTVTDAEQMATVEIKVDSDTAYQEDPVSGDLIIEVEFENHPAKGRLTIHKEGEVVKGFDKDFIHEEASLAGAVFEVYAAEDIYTADHQKDENGKSWMQSRGYRSSGTFSMWVPAMV